MFTALLLAQLEVANSQLPEIDRSAIIFGEGRQERLCPFIGDALARQTPNSYDTLIAMCNGIANANSYELIRKCITDFFDVPRGCENEFLPSQVMVLIPRSDTSSREDILARLPQIPQWEKKNYIIYGPHLPFPENLND